jgi:hypothetical protein
MSVNDFLNTNVGVTLAFILTWSAAVWAYKNNKDDHGRLGQKVDNARDDISLAVNRLGDKIDSVREAITHHETVWHAPKQSRTTKKVAARKK